MSDLANIRELEGVMDHVDRITRALADVARGEYSPRVTTPHGEDHPLGALARGVNEMIEALAAEQDKSAVYRVELEEKIALIDQQRAAIRELSTPIIEVWENVVCLPVVGVLDSTRSAEMTESLLTAIVEKKARCAIIDITGIQVMDTATADHFLRMAKSVKLLGSECMLTGIHPNIAQTIVHMGVDLSDVATHRSLRNALTRYLARSRHGSA